MFVGLLLAAVALLILQYTSEVESQTQSKLIFFKDREGFMNAILAWTPSVSPAIVSQHLTVVVNGTPVFDSDIADNTTAQYSTPVNPGDNVSATLTAFNGTLRSDAVTVNGVAPAAPAAPTGFAISFA